MNRLKNEKSPYLQLHAENPIDWYPWGPEVLALARDSQKPIFLSIGYSACHWCHVMAMESFEDREIAEILNRDFVAVKVDKEERPDLDAVYMDAVTLTTGAGGWPMTLLLTPERVPFFAATYVTKKQLLALLEKAARAWQADAAAIRETAGRFLFHLRKIAVLCPPPADYDENLLQDARKAYAALYDGRYGGFGRAPKFPAGHNVLFLLALYEKTGDADALRMAEGTLRGMARGGIFDAVGGGFCRYSTDEKWLIPHFEKMLYDNALLLWAYAEAGRITKNPVYIDVARRTLDYLLREMTGPEGQFYSAQDADSEGTEGAYYLFSREEIIALLGHADGIRFCNHYVILPGGNFDGKSLPNRVGGTLEDENAFAPLREKVYAYRKERMALPRDEKVLTA